MNFHRPGLLILPEDGAFRQIATGFALHHGVEPSRIHVLPEAGGWQKVVDAFKQNQVPRLRRHGSLRVLLLVDFDGEVDPPHDRKGRYQSIFESVPEDLRGRTFLLGPADEAEDLKKELGRSGAERAGGLLADGCPDDPDEVWTGPQLRHNRDELTRLRASVGAFLLRHP